MSHGSFLLALHLPSEILSLLFISMVRWVLFGRGHCTLHTAVVLFEWQPRTSSSGSNGSSTPRTRCEGIQYGYRMNETNKKRKKKKFNVSLMKLYGAIWPVKHMRYVWGLRPCICTHCIVSDRKLCFWYYLCCGSVQSTLYTLYVAASCKSGIGW